MPEFMFGSFKAFYSYSVVGDSSVWLKTQYIAHNGPNLWSSSCLSFQIAGTVDMEHHVQLFPFVL